MNFFPFLSNFILWKTNIYLTDRQVTLWKLRLVTEKNILTLVRPKIHAIYKILADYYVLLLFGRLGWFFLFACFFWLSVFWILYQFMWVRPEFGSPSYEFNAKHHRVALLIITKNCMYLTYIDPFRSPPKETRCSPTSVALNNHHDQSGRTKTKATSSPRENCFSLFYHRIKDVETELVKSGSKTIP